MSPIDRELERTLSQRAGSLEPPADLYAAVTKEAGAMRRRRQGAVAGAALTVLALAVAVPLAMRDDSPRSAPPIGQTSETPTASTEPTAEPSTVESPTATPTTAPPAQVAAVPVYYVGTKGHRPVLYREFHRVDTAGGKALAGARLAVATQPKDADYSNVFPSGSGVNSVTVAGTVATVDLNARAAEGSGGAALEEAALQAIVWSVTAADSTVKSVKFTIDGSVQEDFWGHADLSGTFQRDAQENILAPVWLLQPEPGSTVGRTFTIGGQATVFEATVSWEIWVNGAKFADGFATASNGAPARGDWSDTISLGATLQPGAKLEIRAFESSAEDGRPMFTDSKTITLG